MNRSTRLKRHTELKRGGPLRRTWMRRTPPKPAVPSDIRAALAKRSGKVCEARTGRKGCAA